MKDNIYLLDLHETLILYNGEMIITRVAGGWIYEIRKPQANLLELVFVPFNNEFQIH